MLSQTLFTLTLTTLTTAHFELLHPPTADFISDSQYDSPCGGASVTVSSDSPEIGVDGFSIALMNSHSTSDWQFSATTDTEPPYDFQPIANVVYTEGEGEFCLSAFSVPEEYAGMGGVVQVVGSGHGGFLYQCAPVNFVSGSTSPDSSDCRNASSSFTASWTNRAAMEEDGEATEDGADDHSHSHADGDDHSHSDDDESAAATVTDAVAAEQTQSEGAAPAATMGFGVVLGGLGFLAAGLAL